MNGLTRLRGRAFNAAQMVALIFSVMVLLAGCVSSTDLARPKPRLIVFLVVDGLPEHQVLDYRDQLAPDGFRRFLDRGAWFAQAFYGHSHTVTAAGHATMLTGAYPHRTGIIGNEWIDPITGAQVYCTSDDAYTYLENDTPKLAGTSPRNLQVETLGDVMRRANPRAKVIGISAKDRGAILPAGHSGTAYMYMPETGRFASSTYYMKEHPAWVKAFNNPVPAKRYFKSTWSPLLPEAAYARSQPDGRPWYGPGGRLPKTFGEKRPQPDAAFYGSLLPSPFMDEMTLDFARAALAGENLGADEVTDILSVSLSGHDYVNHAFGAESRLSQDHFLRLDRLLESFFKDLDQTVGPDNYITVLTADHGFTPVPAYSRSQGLDADQQDINGALNRLNAGLSAKFGAARWVSGFSADGVLLDRKLIEARRIDRPAFDAEAHKLLLAEPGIIAAFSRAEIEGSALPQDTPFLTQVRNSWYRERSADIQLVVRPYWLFGSPGRTGTTHGSPHEYDTHVPILFFGPGWIEPGRIDARVEVVDIAPTLAHIVGAAVPAASEGKPLPLPAIR
jgi:predicted AlkP superfamily pyrophosphatase or phosphodiesterase